MNLEADDRCHFRVQISPVDPEAAKISIASLFDRLDAMPRVHLDLDGSFVYRSDDNTNQIDGAIYDLHGFLRFLELLGQANRPNFQRIVRVLFEDENDLCVQDLGSGIVYSLGDFEDFAWGECP